MQKLTYKIGTGIATAALLGSTLASVAFADTTVTIKGNGENSHNTATVVNKCKSSVYQSNNTEVGIAAHVSSNTGGNEASGSTGGDVTIETGEAKSLVKVTVEGSTNTAEVPDCCECNQGDVDVKIKGNAKGSDNDVLVVDVNKTRVSQRNSTSVGVLASVKSKTGKNKANGSTNGYVKIKTKDATSKVKVSVAGGTNSL